ncbi:hypothetical protein LZ554_009563 [Drepanopeziza brunnea f. sp. 'monogermtubi']|nr:hypothetical protein LZ554_009563 [Drepanopeziza brunnea f. sp. 'monogermtubi']
MSLDDSSLGRSSRTTPSTLTEITFRPHSAHCYFFTAVVRDRCDGRGISFGQIVGLIASIGYMGKIDDFTIKPMKKDSFLVTGFSRHTSTRLSSSGRILSTTSEADSDHVDATRTKTRQGRAVDAGALASRSEPSSSDDDGGLSDSDPEFSSDDGKFSSGSKHSRWDGIGEQRLLAYSKEGRPWDWIFKEFQSRTQAAIRTRLTMVRKKMLP